jgi:spore cortex biosynthesis protein YabQ
MSLNNQFVTLGLMVTSGLGLGILFDLYRVLTEFLNIKRWLTSIFDFLYGIIAALAVFQVLYYSNHGQLRLFVFIGLFVGIMIYYRLFSLAVIHTFKRLITLIQWLFNVLIMTPIKAVYKLIVIIFAFLKALTIFFYKLMLQLSYPLQFLIFRPLGWIFRHIQWPARLRKEFKRVLSFIQRLFRKF